MTRARPTPPRPDLLRRPTGGFGWLDDRLLHDRWLGELGVDSLAVLVLLALAADRHGASFYGRARIAVSLAMDVDRVDRALHRLEHQALVAFRPWRPGLRDGVWQLLPVPTPASQRDGRCVSAQDVLRRLGFGLDADATAEPAAS